MHQSTKTPAHSHQPPPTGQRGGLARRQRPHAAFTAVLGHYQQADMLTEAEGLARNRHATGAYAGSF